jgi:hypothetical protein
MKTRISTTACTLTAGMLLGLSSQAATIYSDDFNFTGTLNTRTPTETTGGAQWVSSDTIWTANGSSLSPGAATRSAYLPFVPQSGMIYELTARMSNADSTSTNWISLGFNANAAPEVTANFTGNNGIGTVILRENGQNQTYSGPAVGGVGSGTGLTIPGYAAGTFYEFKIVLNTMATNWTFDVYRDGTQLDVNGGLAGSTHTWTTNPTIGSVQLSSNSTSGSARYDSFSLVAIPEPSSVLSLVTAGALGLLRRRR